MSDGLTARQTQILKCIIDEYIETAEAVGSEALEKKYSLGVSPATIRNEMASLTKLGFLRQLHTSAGRVPSPKAMKFLKKYTNDNNRTVHAHFSTVLVVIVCILLSGCIKSEHDNVK